MRIQPVILAGGEGRRLFPLSTPEYPKIFATTPCGMSLLAATLARLPGHWLPPLLVGQFRHRYALLNHAHEAGFLPGAVLLEPQAKNTAMATATAVAYLQHPQAQDVVLAVLPADHHIADVALWQRTVERLAAHTLAQHRLGVLGRTPQQFSPEFGYMRALADARGAPMPVQQFIEKPAALAAPLAQYALNLGQFIGPLAAFRGALAQHAPDVWHSAQQAVQQGLTHYEYFVLSGDAYAQAPVQPFDKAVLERTHALDMLALQCGWCDLGSVAAWEAFTGQPLAASLPAHPRTDRPWGYYELLAQQAHEVKKRLTVLPSRRLSLQRHHQRRELWQVLSGEAQVLRNNEAFHLRAGESILIPEGAWHRLGNAAPVPLVIEETQSGAPDEADIERADDDYGRS